MAFKNYIEKYRLWIAGVAAIFFVWFFFFRGDGSLTQSQFEEKLKSDSGGKITVTKGEISPISKGNGLYMGEWNGLKISAKADENRNILPPYWVVTPPAGLMDEIALGQYQELIQYVSMIADPSLSSKDAQHLINNELNFNNQIMTGEDHSTTKNNYKYELSGGGKETTWFSFMIVKDDK
ncbi:hypothetical protein bcgnr5390_10760 [Bacillus luti]|nr:hypothetical protein BC2903_30140 [Bacillus cereus]